MANRWFRVFTNGEEMGAVEAATRAEAKRKARALYRAPVDCIG